LENSYYISKIYNVNITLSGITSSYIMYLINDSILLFLFYKNGLCTYLKYCQLLYTADMIWPIVKMCYNL